MATTTDDPRIKKIESETVYGLHHHDNLIYIGSTCRPLKRRLQEHKKEASRRSTPLYEYLENEVEHFGNVSINELPQQSEKEALKDWGEYTLNSYAPEDTEYSGPDWTPKMVDILEDSNSAMEASERLGIPYHRAHDAREELGLGANNDYRRLSDHEVRLIWIDYHVEEEATYREVADRYDVSTATVSEIIRRERHEDVWVPSKTALEVAQAYTKDRAEA